MTIHTTVTPIHQHAAVIALSGRLTSANSAELRDQVTKTVAAGTHRIALDLSALEFIDSSGLGAIIGGLKTARQAGGDLRIVSPGEQVVMVLRLTNLDQVLPTYGTVAEALSDVEP